MVKHPILRALVLGLALIAASCSGSAETVSTEAAPVAESGGDEDEAGSDAMAGDEPASDDPADSEDPSVPPSGPPPSLPPEEARAAAEQNISNLQTSDDVRDIEVVSVYDGSVTSLREVVTGDRPVLVWFWAPH